MAVEEASTSSRPPPAERQRMYNLILSCLNVIYVVYLELGSVQIYGLFNNHLAPDCQGGYAINPESFGFLGLDENFEIVI